VRSLDDKGEPLADEASDKPRPFDVQTVRYLVRLMHRYDLSEIDLQDGEERIRIRKGSLVRPGPVAAAVSGPAQAPLVAHETPKPAATPAAPSKQLIEIKAPAVGTFYAQREPGSPPYVTVGTRVSPATIVCIIEAMKVLNEIPADCSGVIQEVVAKNKDFVEYGTVLFRVDPNG
jgi:acetyl-CoA carboxylase biotin carboxyl carrier protein